MLVQYAQKGSEKSQCFFFFQCVSSLLQLFALSIRVIITTTTTGFSFHTKTDISAYGPAKQCCSVLSHGDDARVLTPPWSKKERKYSHRVSYNSFPRAAIIVAPKGLRLTLQYHATSNCREQVCHIRRRPSNGTTGREREAGSRKQNPVVPPLLNAQQN